MEVSVLSMQKIDNFGSVLQSFGLKNLLESLGCNVYFVDFEKRNDDPVLLEKEKERFLDESENRGSHNLFSKVDRYIFNRIKNKILWKKQKKIFDSFRRKYLKINKSKDFFDLCVIGSDEVFNCLNNGNIGFCSCLFGNVKNARVVISYAASCGTTTFDKLPPKLIPAIKCSLLTLSDISVRDFNTRRFVEAFGFSNVSDNLDPVLVSDFDRYINEAITPKLPKHYCLIYSYPNRINNKDEISMIINFCKKNNLVPISVGGYQFWCKKHYSVDPFVCLKMFKQADFVITDTFHGTIFSVKYTDRFSIIVRNSNSNKIKDLIEKMSIDEHVLRSPSDLDGVFVKRHNKERTNSIIKLETINTMNYLAKYAKQ